MKERYIICARSPTSGRLLYLNVQGNLSTRGRSRKFASLSDAWKVGRSILKQYPQVRDYTLHARPLTPVKTNPKKRRNPSGYARARDGYLAELDKAADAFQTFTGREATKEKVFRAPVPKSGFELGPLIDVTYEQDRGDGRTYYKHTFRKNSRPLLVASSDGKSVCVVGGRYKVNPELGIVDE